MHDTALFFGKKFFDTYAQGAKGLTIAEIGSQDVNGALRSVAPPNNRYIGLDFITAKGVDIVIDDPYKLPLEDASVDICVTSSCLEHSEFFWLVFNEVMRILKPSGLFYIAVPANGAFHRYPVDCWRFYPDSGLALRNWGRRSGYPVALLESFTGLQQADMWNDLVAVFLKDEKHINQYPQRMQHGLTQYTNGLTYEKNELSNYTLRPQDMDAHVKLQALIRSYHQILAPRNAQ